jgi:hypothetical protein
MRASNNPFNLVEVNVEAVCTCAAATAGDYNVIAACVRHAVPYFAVGGHQTCEELESYAPVHAQVFAFQRAQYRKSIGY